jgi:hypothetical protein
MTEHSSGDFVYYRNTDNEGAPEEIGLVLRTSSNDKKDGSTDDYVELVGPFTKVLVPDDHCRKFDAPEKEDPNEVVGGSSGDVGSVKRPTTTGTAKGK